MSKRRWVIGGLQKHLPLLALRLTGTESWKLFVNHPEITTYLAQFRGHPFLFSYLQTGNSWVTQRKE
jgi:hypothetical protein